MKYKNLSLPIKRVIAKTNAQKWTRGTVHSVHGNLITLKLGMTPNLIKHVEVVGDISQCTPGVEVPIVWKNRRPVAMPGSQAIIQADTPNASTLSPYQNRIDIWWNHGVWSTPVSIGPIASQAYYFYVHQLVDAVGDSASFTVALDEGVYAIDWFGQLHSSGGIFDLYVDGVLFCPGNDTYASTNVLNTVLNFGPINLSRGQHTFLFVVTGRNSGSAGYLMVGTLLSIYPSGG
jgi:hypothetical protein